MTNPNGGKQAVILSGGGANGAYEIGVMKALFAGKCSATAYQPLDPDIFAGTSVGSYNAAFLVARWGTYGSAAIASLEQTWLDDISSSRQKPHNGVFRIRDDPREFINPQSFLSGSLEPFYHLVNDSASLAWDGLQRVVNLVTAQGTSLLERVVQLFDFSSFVSLEPFRQLINNTIWFAEIRRSTKDLIIITTNWEMGQLRIFNNHDMTDQLGPAIIMGSSALPGFFPPTPIGAQLFVDGGVLLNTPLNPAIDAGADNLHVISMFPDVKNIPLTKTTSTLETVYRQQLIGWAKTLEASIRRVRDINQSLALAAFATRALEKLRGTATEEQLFAELIAELRLQHLERYKVFRPVTVHRYYPGDDLSGPLGLLDFDRDRIKQLIEQGFEDAIDHDCEKEACVLLTPVASADRATE